jgi:hypothetical protein
MIDEDKDTLATKRAELIEASQKPSIPHAERSRLQNELSIVNAKLKAINIAEAAQLRQAAHQRKIAGLEEAKANAARAAERAQPKTNGNARAPRDEENDEDDDPGQTAAIDGWIDAVLLRHDVEFSRSPEGTLAVKDTPEADVWALVGVLVDAVYAAARGQELPDLPTPARKAQKKVGAKPKKR